MYQDVWLLGNGLHSNGLCGDGLHGNGLGGDVMFVDGLCSYVLFYDGLWYSHHRSWRGPFTYF